MESQVLFDLSDAYLVAVLDIVRTDEISTAWTEAQTRYLTEGAEEAIGFLSGAIVERKKGDESDWIVNWLSRALKKGVHARMYPYGLAARDIIEYLPSRSWSQRLRKPGMSSGANTMQQCQP